MELTILLSSVAFFVYGAICIISVIFTFFIETYNKLDEILNLDVISSKILTPLDKSKIDIIDTWLIERRRIIGPILIFLSLFDLKLYLNIINQL